MKTKLLTNLKDLIFDLLTLLLVGLSVGFTLGIVSNIFVKGVMFLNNLRSENTLPDQFSIFSTTCSLLIAALIILLIRKVFDISRWHGPPDSILAAHQSKNTLDIKRGLGSTLTAFVSAGGGASVGQYGPLVHFGATMASAIEKFTSERLPPGIFIGCGVAAAISAGFNAPIAGLVFAHEAILRHFSLRAGGAIAISSITASTIGTGFFPGSDVLNVASEAPRLTQIAPIILLVSPIFGLSAILFMFGIRSGAKVSKLSGLSPTYQILIAAFLCGIIGIFVPEILGLGTREMNNIFSEMYNISFLFILLVGKIITTSICIGFGFFGGIFAPALFVGAATGGLVAKLIILFGFSISIPAMAIAGTAAVGAVAIGAPVATTLIVLEFTGSYEYAVAAMIAVQISSFISHRLYGDSLFDMALNDRGVKINLGRQHVQMDDLRLSEIVNKDAIVFDEKQHHDQIKKVMINKKVTEAVVINNQGLFIGKINIHKVLEESNSKLLAPSFIEKNSLVLNNNISLVEAIEQVSNFVGEFIPVKDIDTGSYIGSINEADLFQAYLRLQNRVLKVEKDTES